MSEPRTEAGRRLLGVAYLAGDAASEGVDLAEAIAAIEREAAAEAVQYGFREGASYVATVRDDGAAGSAGADPEPHELLRDLVQHWDAGDIDHDYDAITSAFDSAREYVRSTIGLSGEHRHPARAQGGPPLSDGDAGFCPTCTLRTCIGRLQYEDCVHLDVERIEAALIEAENDDQMGPEYSPRRLAEYLAVRLAARLAPADPVEET